MEPKKIHIHNASEYREILDKDKNVVAMFIPGVAKDALPLETRVAKTESKPKDSHQDGSLGTIVSSFDLRELPEAPCNFAYFVCWDDEPHLPVFTLGFKIIAV